MVAAAAVYMSHMPQPRSLNSTVATFMSAGYNGVTLFFVLSGFVLGLNYFDQMTTPTARGTWNYAVARVARVYPLYLAVLLYVVVEMAASGRSLDGLGLHIVAIQSWSPSLLVASGFNGPAWSISVEFFLYACFPLLVLAFARLRRPAALCLALVLVVVAVFALAAWFVATGRDDLTRLDPGSDHRWLYRMPLTRLGDFAAGILLSRLYLAWREDRRAVRSARPFVVVGSVATIALMCSDGHLLSAWSFDASYVLPALAIIWGLAMLGEGRFLGSGAMVAAGEASYAFYLIHTVVMFDLGAGQWTSGITVWAVTHEVMIFLLVVAIAIGLHRMIERPARRRLRAFASVPTQRRVAAPEAAL